MIYSYTVVHRQPTEGIDVPFVLALIELDEGFQMLSHLVDVDLEAVRSGMRVQARFEPVSEVITLPLFSLEAMNSDSPS